MPRAWWAVATAPLLALAVVALLATLGCDSVNNNVQARDGAATGTIVTLTGQPLENALVAWEVDERRAGVTGADGRFTVEGLYFGDQNLIVSRSGYRTKKVGVKVYSGIMTAMQPVALETVSFEYRDITVAEVSATHARITWKTTDYTNGVLQYGETEALGSAVRESAREYKTLHELRLDGLKPQRRYFFQIVASRENRAAETAPLLQFQTLSALEDRTGPDAPRVISASLDGYPNQVTVTWSAVPDTDLKGYRLYRAENPLAGFTAIPALVPKGSERYTDVGLVAGRKYYYRVAAVDQAGNAGGQSDIVEMVIPGDLSTEITWTRSHSPYRLDGDLTVTSSGRLTIDPGVEVLIGDYDAIRRGDPAKVEIKVEGSLVATGSALDPVVIASGRAQPQAGDWGGVRFAIDSLNLGPSSISGLRILHAETGLTVDRAGPAIDNVIVGHCRTGLRVQGTVGYRVASLTAIYCTDGLVLSGNTNLTVADSTAYHCARGITSSDNDSVTYSANNCLECRDVGLSINDAGGRLVVSDNLFVSGTGLGLKIVDRPVEVEYNTFDIPSGIQIDKGSTTIRRNILTTARSLNGGGVKAIEHLAGVTPLPVYSENNIIGFPAGMDYVGCASGSWAIASQPLFLKDYGGAPYDYRLRIGLPDQTDPWGIRRTRVPF